MTDYHDDWLTILHGDVRERLSDLPDRSVHCVVTSPPYWALRDYGTATWDGGEKDCPHRAPATGPTQNKGNNNRWGRPFAVVCGLCGARRVDAQLGLEPTPEEYVASLVAVFREVRRVLRDDGTLWLNLGDSYAVGTVGRSDDDSLPRPKGGHLVGTSSPGMQGTRTRPFGLKPKDLVGVPWRVAFALQADGWYLRSDIIWSKPNPMPESVTDRPTKSHEYLFLLSKGPRYFYDTEAVREPAQSGPSDLRKMAESKDRIGGLVKEQTDPLLKASALTNIGRKRSVGGRPLGTWPGIGPKHGQSDNHKSDYEPMEAHAGRNLRSVWTIATEPYPGAHFATFPQKLVEPCVKAGTSEHGVCPECGAPWVREVVVDYRDAPGGSRRHSGAHVKGIGEMRTNDRALKDVTTTGWRPTCKHNAEPVPATVLDPFGGSGTVAVVAERLGRKSILIELNAEYVGQAMERVAQGRREGTGAPYDMPLPFPVDSLWAEGIE